VGTSNRSLWLKGFGDTAYDKGVKVTATTVYDLASLTKVIGTTSVIMALVRDGKLKLTDRVGMYLPEFIEGSIDRDQRAWRRQVSVEHLLTHSAGLPAWKPFYKKYDSYRSVLNAVIATPLDAPPGKRYRYSDLGFMILGELASRAAAEPLASLEQRLVFEPLQMKHTRRNPPLSWRDRIAPTERRADGKGFVHGVVHDENAAAAQGVTGHAGLFSTAQDLARFAQELLKARRDRGRIFNKQMVLSFTQRRDLIAGSSRAIGWDTATGGNSAGSQLSRSSFGHTGFTGTSLWIDPQRDLYIILLTNRVHPTRKNAKIGAVRKELADAIVRAIDSPRK